MNLYIETSGRGPAKRRMAGAWIVEYISAAGRPVTRGGLLYADIITENEMALRLLIKAFSILTKTCCVRVFTQCTHVLNVMQNHWIWQWQKNGWRNAKEKPVGNADLWQQAAELIEKHITEWTDEEHSYRQCMMARMERETRREHEIKEPGNCLIIDTPEWNTR